MLFIYDLARRSIIFTQEGKVRETCLVCEHVGIGRSGQPFTSHRDDVQACHQGAPRGTLLRHHAQ